MPPEALAISIRRKLHGGSVARTIGVGDLVKRRYDLRLEHVRTFGVVLERDRNGFLTVIWGEKVEHMWDDYDLVRVDEG